MGTELNKLPPLSLALGCRRRSAKAHKVREGKLRFVLGRDIYMERAEELCKRALIGRLEYTQMGKEEWLSWAAENWKPLFSYTPSISLLANNWLVIVFIEAVDATRILGSLWTVLRGSLFLSR